MCLLLFPGQSSQRAPSWNNVFVRLEMIERDCWVEGVEERAVVPAEPKERKSPFSPIVPPGSSVPYSEFAFYAPAPWQAWNRSFCGAMLFHILL